MPRRGQAAKRDLDMQRVIADLHSAVPKSTRVPASLAIVAVDNGPVVAQAVAALIRAYASQGSQVIAADLSSGAYLAHLSEVQGPGVQTVSRDGVNFVMAVPDRDDPVPVVLCPRSPRRRGPPKTRWSLPMSPRIFCSLWSPSIPLLAGSTSRLGQLMRSSS